MLYEVITHSGCRSYTSVALVDSGLSTKTGTSGILPSWCNSCRKNTIVITSYSIHYTKLYDEPFQFRSLKYTANVEESKQLNMMPGPAIIISSSGMCEAGRILHHLKNNLENPRNIVLFVGYQAENTLGRRLVERISPVSYNFV